MKKIVFSTLNKKRDINFLIEKRSNIILFFVILFFFIIIAKLYSVQMINYDKYAMKAESLSETIAYSNSAPRGRIYDRNYNLLVDNKVVKTIYYKKPDDITSLEEVELAYSIANILKVDYSKLYTRNLKEFWLVVNDSLGKDKITEDEWKNLSERKLTLDDIYKLKIDRITDEELELLTDVDRETAYIYYLMNKGYSYDKKIIKNNSVTDTEYALISENMNKYIGFTAELDWERVYLYGDSFKSIFGSVSNQTQGIPLELKDYYLNMGYELNDRVGTSYLEFQYESYLRGTKTKYSVNSDNTYEVLEEGNRGNDIVLTIDIELQRYIEKLLEKEMIKAKKEANTKYYDKTFVIVTEPSTGEILAMAGKQIIKKNGKYSFVDYTPGVFTTSVTAGSIVKGASITTGYREGVIDIGSKFYDTCLKIKSTPLKCSWRSMGWVDDLTALKWSSNVYQYRTAILVGGGNYSYNSGLFIDPEAFNIYRDTFSEYGLGVKTGIDLPNENLGYKGNSTMPGHLLDFAIGQYDTYTPIQISQYVSTIANDGVRLKMQLLKEVYTSNIDGKLDSLIYSYSPVILNTVNIEEKYISRIQKGFSLVMNSGTGYGYMNLKYNPSGKTGTAESFLDSDGDGNIDKETVTKSFIGYAPSTNPEMTITVTSPDLRYSENGSTAVSGINKRITSSITNFFFSNR